MFIIKANYKTTKNTFEIKNGFALMTVLKKNGDPLVTTINIADMERVQNEGIWFAEWNKDLNTYLVQNLSSTKLNKKSKPLKQSLHTFILEKNPLTPVKHLNGDYLDNRRANLEVINLREVNETEIVDENTTAIILKDKYGNENARALVNSKDVRRVVNNKYTWVYTKVFGKPYVVANNKEGRVYLDKLILRAEEWQTVIHINLDPLDNRRENLEIKETIV